MRVIGGRYELADRIGGGGMADVFRAHDRTLGRDVAVKLMRPAFANDPEFVERFHREFEALGAIDHPNIVRVLDYGASAGGPFIVMELVRGGTLRDLMRTLGRVDQYAAAEIVAAIADGLEAAHVRGVLHRDLKPDNVLLDGEGRPKIADFGIARLAAATAITRTGELLGTPQYLAPEQMSGDVVDERADVYSLGVILYEMLTGTQPTGGTTPSEIVSRRLRVDPRPPSRLVALAPALNALVLRALARDPGRRVRRAADLRAALLAIKPPAPRVPTRARVVRLGAPSLAPLVAGLTLLAASARDRALRFGRAVDLRVSALGAALLAIKPPSLAPLLAARPKGAPATTRVRVVRPPRRSPAALLAALALLAAFVGGSLTFAGWRPSAVAPVAIATVAPASTAAVLASTASPAVTASPSAPPEPTAEPTPEPTAAPTIAPVATVSGDPAGTIVAFYRLISGHDYVSASGLWSDRMKASYP
ncbi:MAG: serine/threonine protein kinase, partial [Chloroflexota bacterium]|nr:serine/threonine protein kinase [Chloroflexota bacterium]